MIKRIMLRILAVFFPWSIFLINHNPGGALVALVMQATIIGWIPAIFWAFRIIGENEKTISPPDESNKKK